ncbi:MAG: hypothetical protein JF603_06175 [Acidobacteria bacterium]|nr:hypothetical protein [Acidobacteriota bacterium]
MRKWLLCAVCVLCVVPVAIESASSAFGQEKVTPASSDGYWLSRDDGAVYPFGAAATTFGPASVIRGMRGDVVDIAATPARDGYSLVTSVGGVFTFGAAHFYGSASRLRLHSPIVGIAPTRDGHGYWLVARNGGIFSFGDAPYLGRGPAPQGHSFTGIAAS